MSKTVQRLGTTGFQYYDPYEARFQRHLKKLIVDGIPILIRIYSGFDYPLDASELHGTVDREGHVVVVVGYDQASDTFEVMDPWNADRWGGEFGGLRAIPATVLPIICMDATCDQSTVMLPFRVEVGVNSRAPQTVVLRATIDYRCPVPLDPTKSPIDPLIVRAVAPSGFELTEGSRVARLGRFLPGEVRMVEWRFDGQAESSDAEFQIQAFGMVHGQDPYDYADLVGETARVEVPALPAEQTVLARA